MTWPKGRSQRVKTAWVGSILQLPVESYSAARRAPSATRGAAASHGTKEAKWVLVGAAGGALLVLPALMVLLLLLLS